jgi:hypothetical protein
MRLARPSRASLRFRPSRANASWTTWAENTSATAGSIRLGDAAPGVAFEIQVRAWSADGTVSDWASARVSQPGDDRDFTVSGPWIRVTSPELYQGSALKTTKRGAKLAMPIAGVNFDLEHPADCGTIAPDHPTKEEERKRSRP